jgi:RNA polymerase sigma factor (TIGR02999 family)
LPPELRQFYGTLVSYRFFFDPFQSQEQDEWLDVYSCARYTQAQACVTVGATSMTDVTHILSAIEAGDPSAAEQLLPLVYDELRKLAAQKLAQEKPGQTLQATALVHEAYLRLVDTKEAQRWDNRRHFFAAAAEAMRRILVENARRKGTVKHGGQRIRIDLDEALTIGTEPRQEVLEIDDLLDRLTNADPKAAELVKLRFFAGLTGEQAAEVLGISPRSADLLWAYARSWLFEKLQHKQS